MRVGLRVGLRVRVRVRVRVRTPSPVPRRVAEHRQRKSSLLVTARATAEDALAMALRGPVVLGVHES